MTVVVLAGGVGAAKFLEGVVQVVPADTVTAIVNTGDDMWHHGLRVCPDLDIVTCTLAGIIDTAQGWGIAGDTTQCMTWLTKLGADDWFTLGDRDLALHIRRSDLLRQHVPLHQVAAQFAEALGVTVRILPMSDDPVETYIRVPEGRIHFEEYFVKRRGQGLIHGAEFAGAANAIPAPGVLAAINAADAILVAPSNPIVSIGTILAIPGIREALVSTAAPIVAVSPIIGGQAVKGPAAPLMQAHGYDVSARGVAECYKDFVDTLVIDHADGALAPDIQALGMDVVVTETLMRDAHSKRELAARALEAAGVR